MRIFSVRINLDSFFASVGVCDTDQDRTAWLQGFQIGALGGQYNTDWSRHKLAGYKIGNDAHCAVLEFSAKQSEKGKASAAARSTAVQPNLNRGSTKPQPSLNQASTISSNRVIEESKEPVNHLSSPVATGPSFDEFWNAYGKKVGRKLCEPYWKAMSVDRRVAAIAGIPGYHATKPDPQFRLDPIRYLKRDAWEDEADPPPPDDSGCTFTEWIPTADEVRELLRGAK